MLEALAREIKAGCPEERFYTDDLALVSTALGWLMPLIDTASFERSIRVKRAQNKC